MMKRSIYTCLICLLSIETVHAQKNTEKFGHWLNDHVSIANSMHTSDLSAQPAQLQATFPQHGANSYLIDAGIAVVVNKNTSYKFISNTNVEYHRNTITYSEQNNFSIGYGYKWNFAQRGGSYYFMTGDVQYVYDGVNINNSIAGTFLFTLLRDGKRLNWNTNNFRLSNRLSFSLAPFAGLQVQDAFKTSQKEMEGFILRPEFIINTSLALNKKAGPPFDKIIDIYCNYTGRDDVINSTAVKENYTQLLQTGIRYYLAYSPFQISLGASFNNGSNPLYGLSKQQYWLISINFMK